MSVVVNKSTLHEHMVSHNKNSRRNHYIKSENRSFENMSKFEYLGTTVTNQNMIHE
jgi:hypothetical protein